MNFKYSSLLNSAYLNFFYVIFFSIFHFFVLRKKKIIIFDIDNTIADTWPTHNGKFKSEYVRLVSIPVFDKIIKIANKHILNGERVVFLTARDYKYYFVTLKWLSEIGFPSANLVMVSKPSEKINLLKSIQTKNVILYDDMSYNHERGLVKFYTKEINEVLKMKNVEYFGYDFLIKLQK